MVKCKYCNEYFDKEKVDCVKIANRYAHKSCYEQKTAEEIQLEHDKDDFYKYVRSLDVQNFDFLKTKRLAEKYVKEYSFTYSGMKKAMYWFYEIKKNHKKRGCSIGILPYIYSDALDYYYSIYLIEKRAKEEVVKIEDIKTDTVRIQTPVARVKKKKLFDMED